jgi:hypothetical protein
MDDKDKDHQDGSIFMVHVINDIFFMEVDLDEHSSNPMISFNKRCNVSNLETLMGTMTHQGGTGGSSTNLA